MPQGTSTVGRLSLACGHLAAGIGCLMWIYPPCEATCDISWQARGFVFLSFGLALTVFGIVVAAATWVRAASAEAGSANGEREERAWLQPLKLDNSTSMLGLPALIIGILIWGAGALIDIYPVTNPTLATFAQKVNAADVLEAGSVLATLGWLTLVSGYMMGWWAEATFEVHDRPLRLSKRQPSMWPVITDMLHAEHSGMPGAEPTAQPQPRSPRKSLVTVGESKMGVGTVLILLGCIGMGAALAVMVSHLAGR